MLRQRPRPSVWGILLHPATGWLVLALLYLAAAVLNFMLALSASATWPLVLTGMFAAVAGLCVVAAARRLRR